MAMINFISALLVYKAISTSAITYVVPTKPLTSCPSLQDDCFTLNEWIESGTHPFTNGTTVSLLGGIHFINSTLDSLLIQCVSSIVFTGDPQQQTTVECNYGFAFKFYNVKDVNISNLHFKSCAAIDVYSTDADISFALMFIASYNILINSVEISNGGVLAVVGSNEGSTFQINSSTLVSGFYLSSVLLSCLQPEKVQFIDSNCSQLVMTQATNDHCFEFSMQRTSIQNVTGYNEALVIDSALKVSFMDVTFWNNSAPLMLVTGNLVEFKGHLLFSRNSGYGGVSLSSCAQIYIYSNTTIEFSNNNIAGEALFTVYNDNNQRSVARSGMGGDDASIIAFVSNTAKSGGIMILESNIRMELSNTQLIFENNTCIASANGDTGILLLDSDATLHLIQSNATFISNRSPLSGGITMISRSVLSISRSTVKFANNHGTDGGGIALYERSRINCLIASTCNLHFDNNTASRKGGAIFTKDSDYINPYTRILKEHSLSSLGEFVLYFSFNTATTAGDDIYGGWIDSALYKPLVTIFQDNRTGTVTSNPTRICVCSNSLPLCNITEHRLEVFPGENFELEAAAVGQRLGIVPSIVSVMQSPDGGSLGTGQVVQSVGRHCTTLHFTVSTQTSIYTLKLRAQDAGTPELTHDKLLRKMLPPEFHILFQQFNVQVVLKPCPLGYEISQKFKKCVCSGIIESHSGVGCDLENNYTITRSEYHWLHATSSTAIVIHDHCPYDYCRGDINSLNFQLEIPDKQCAFSRSGTLCGACQANLSQVFGTSNCKECSSFVAFAIVPTVIIAGILLVGFLMILDFTVSTGTISGLIFYANIVRANHAVFFQTSSFLSTFIAWLNLDLGIEVCFYNGLDAYAKTWLQFVFPFYIWFMVVAMIVGCHYSTTISNICGRKPVHVLATLFLLSYAKIIRVVITAFSYTVLVYPNGLRKQVWLYDGTVEFLKGKHAILFAFSFLIFLLLSVPYTLTLFSIQWLQRFSNYRLLFWVDRLMPLFDAYTGPYKAKHRYWTGLLLLIRVIFLPILVINFTNNPGSNLLAVSVMSSILLTCLALAGGVHKSILNNTLEIASLLNLLLLSVSTLYVIFIGQSRIVTTYISTGVAFIIFVFLVLYHAGQQLMSLKKVKTLKALLVSSIAKRIVTSEQNQTDTNLAVSNTEALTSTELREPLIDY